MSQSIGKTQTQFFEYHDPDNPLVLRVGRPLARFTLAYEMYGRMNADKSNVILLFHAMTGSQHAAGINTTIPGLDGRWTEEVHEGWWNGFIGPNKASTPASSASSASTTWGVVMAQPGRRQSIPRRAPIGDPRSPSCG